MYDYYSNGGGESSDDREDTPVETIEDKVKKLAAQKKIKLEETESSEDSDDEDDDDNED